MKKKKKVIKKKMKRKGVTNMKAKWKESEKKRIERKN